MNLNFSVSEGGAAKALFEGTLLMEMGRFFPMIHQALEARMHAEEALVRLQSLTRMDPEALNKIVGINIPEARTADEFRHQMNEIFEQSVEFKRKADQLTSHYARYGSFPEE